MKVLILDTRPLRRGAQIFAHDLSNALISLKGFSVKKIYLYAVNDGEKLDLNPQDEVLGGNDHHIMEKFPTVHPGLVRLLVHRINAFAPDVMLLNGSRTLKYSAAASLFLKKKPLVIYRVIDSAVFWNNRLHKQLYYRKLIMPHIDGAVGVSEASLRDMSKLHGFEKPSVVIHRAIDAGNFRGVPDRALCRKELSVSVDQKVVVLLGNLTAQKRPDRFIDVVRELRKKIPNLRGWVVGDGPLRQEVETYAKNQGVWENITLFGYQKQVGRFLQAADALLLPSDTEGLPGVVLEAAFFGVPTVSTLVGGVRECIEDGKSGYIVSLWDFEQFVSRTLSLLSDEQNRAEMGENARKKILRDFTMERVVDKYSEFFRQGIKK